MKKLTALLLLLPFSLQARDVTVYFTPNQPVDQVILDAVKTAEHSVYAAAYSFHWPELKNLLWSLKTKSGVDVKIFLDSMPAGDTAAGLKDNIRIDPDKSSLFHAKFIVVDRRLLLVTSLNFTSDNLYLNHNNLLVFRDTELAGFFADKFLTWWNGESSDATYVRPDIEVYFSPEHNCETVICANIAAAGSSIHSANYDFTSEEIAKAVSRRQLAGVPVYGMIEGTKVYPYSVFYFLRDFGADMRKGGLAGLLHDKLFIIDGNTVIAGSYNPTESAKTNTECLLILKDRAVAQTMLKEWYKLWRFRTLP